MFVECSSDHSSSQRDKRVPIFDPYNILAAFEAGHRMLVSISSGLVSAFVIAGAGWKIGQTKELLGRTLNHDKSSAPPPSLARHPDLRLDLDEQFTCTAKVVQAALDKSHTVRKVQAAASEKLDATEYALNRMLDELSLVMPAIQRRRDVTTNLPYHADTSRSGIALAA